MQHKNKYYISGAIMLMQPVTNRPFKNKDGETVDNKERIIVIRHKMSQYGRWKINDITVHCKGEAIEQLSLMKPGLEVIADFSIEVISWIPKGETEEKRFQKLVCRNIMSPTDKYKTEKWWADKNREPSRKVKDNPMKLSEQEEKRKMPDDRSYDIKSYDRGKDYSHDGSSKIEEIKFNVLEDDELPF